MKKLFFLCLMFVLSFMSSNVFGQELKLLDSESAWKKNLFIEKNNPESDTIYVVKNRKEYLQIVLKYAIKYNYKNYLNSLKDEAGMEEWFYGSLRFHIMNGIIIKYITITEKMMLEKDMIFRQPAQTKIDGEYVQYESISFSFIYSKDLSKKQGIFGIDNR
jgi:hypothetical protein